MELQGQQQMQLISLKRQYNKLLIRYNKMEEWIETATIEEQKKLSDHILEVINDCNDLLNQIKKYGPVTQEEIIEGFKI